MLSSSLTNLRARNKSNPCPRVYLSPGKRKNGLTFVISGRYISFLLYKVFYEPTGNTR